MSIYDRVGGLKVQCRQSFPDGYGLFGCNLPPAQPRHSREKITDTSLAPPKRSAPKEEPGASAPAPTLSNQTQNLPSQTGRPLAAYNLHRPDLSKLEDLIVYTIPEFTMKVDSSVHHRGPHFGEKVDDIRDWQFGLFNGRLGSKYPLKLTES